MKKLLILSGKGGTGKTTVAGSFITYSKAKAFADCDVDAPNLHMITKKNAQYTEKDFIGSDKAVIDQDKCISCGKCHQVCRFNAVSNKDGNYSIDEFACEGCAVCSLVCPVDAIQLNKDVAGSLRLSVDNSIFSTAKLKMGRGNSGKLVTEVKKQLDNTIEEKKCDAQLAIIDGSPGIGCPVIASISNVDMVLIVTEPSLSGLNDMGRIIKTAEVFQIKIAVCLNKCTENSTITPLIEAFCKQENIPFIGKIPYDNNVSKAINKGISVIDIDCEASKSIKKIYKRTMEILMGEEK